MRSFMEHGANVWDPCQSYNSEKIDMVRRSAMLLKRRYGSSVSEIINLAGMAAAFSKETGFIILYIIINGLAELPFDGVLIKVYLI